MLVCLVKLCALSKKLVENLKVREMANQRYCTYLTTWMLEKNFI